MYSKEFFNGMMTERLLTQSKKVFDQHRPQPIPLHTPPIHHYHQTIVEVEKPSPTPPPPGIAPEYFESIQANKAYEAYVFPLSIVSRHLLEANYIEPELGKFEKIAHDSLLKSQANFFSNLDSIGLEALSLVTSSDLKYMQNFFAYLNKSNDLIYSSALRATKSRFKTNDQIALLDRDLLETQLLLNDSDDNSF